MRYFFGLLNKLARRAAYAIWYAVEDDDDGECVDDEDGDDDDDDDNEDHHFNWTTKTKLLITEGNRERASGTARSKGYLIFCRLLHSPSCASHCIGIVRVIPLVKSFTCFPRA